MWDFIFCQILTGLLTDGHRLQTLLAISRGFMFGLFPAAPSHLPYTVTQLLHITAAVCVFALSLSPRFVGLPFRNYEVTMSTHTQEHLQRHVNRWPGGADWPALF